MIGVILLNIGFLSDLEGKAVPRVGVANQLTLGRIAMLPCSLH
jgi:hypothetical protein